MSSIAARRLFSTSARRMSDALKQDTKRNPETIILGGLMVAALGGAGYYLGRNPTNPTSENLVHIAKDGMPWESEGSGKYKYHPNGDGRAEPRDAPSALNAVIVPNVTLPKEMHDKYNKYGRE